MRDNEKEILKYEQLLERVKELELENDSITERAEEVLLLGILSDTISSIEDKFELIEELLEKISILRYIPLCCCYEWTSDRYVLVRDYTSAAFNGQPAKYIKLNEEALKEVREYGAYCDVACDVISDDTSFEISKDSQLLIINFHNKSIDEGVFLFMDDKKGYPLAAKILVIKQAIRMVMDRIDKLEYIKQIEQLNVSLEVRVKDRTKELSQINAKLLVEIEERKLVEKKLLAAKDKAQESEKLKTMFLANMSHEIRTPMNAIVGFSELMESGDCTKREQKDYSRLIYRNSLSLLNLINDLLDFSKIEANQLTLHCSRCNINTILVDVYSLAHLFLKQYNRENIQIKIYKSLPSEEAYVYTDELRLKQVLINLLSNAIKFSLEGSIIIKYEIVNDFVYFSVSDSGIGIDKSMHEDIFNRFSRVSDDINKPIAGNGLGLTITRNLVQMLGGKIAVESELRKGATFKFHIAAKANTGSNS